MSQSPGEFDLIQRYFNRPAPDTVVGNGDDAAIVRFSGTCTVAADMLVAGRHFAFDDNPRDIGWKAMAVNVSDMAAMGANPRYALLSLALPDINEPWLAEFSEGLFECADTFGVQLIGGDTTCGPLTIALTLMGDSAAHPPLRKNARIHDDIWVSGVPGLAALGLLVKTHKVNLPEPEKFRCLRRLDRPVPRAALGKALDGIAHAMIDISDGLLADLNHILQQSGVGARVGLDALLQKDDAFSKVSSDIALNAIAYGGDDYELCFTAAQSDRLRIQAMQDLFEFPLTRLGTIERNPALTIAVNQTPVRLTGHGFDHFKPS